MKDFNEFENMLEEYGVTSMDNGAKSKWIIRLTLDKFTTKNITLDDIDYCLKTIYQKLYKRYIVIII